MNEDIKPCPSCGADVEVAIIDEFATILSQMEFENKPTYLGVSFVYYHPIHKSPDCIIAKDYSDLDGISLFENREDCINAWNKRI